MSDTSLSQLHDIVLPAPVPFWPPAPGWYFLLGLLLLGALVIGAWAVRRYRANAYRRAALRELDSIERLQDTEALEQLPELLKRTALAAWPRTVVAPLSGERWHRFLTASLARPAPGSGEWALGLETLSYEGAGALAGSQEEEVLRFCRFWIRHHRVVNIQP